MATVLSTLYPPLIDTFMPAFLAEGRATATFSISPYNTNNTINRIHVSLVSQQSNLNVFGQNSVAAQGTVPAGTSLIDGIWIVSKEEASTYLTYDNISELWTLTIPRNLLRKQSNSVDTPFSIDGYYKLQLRFDDSSNSINNNYLTTERAHFSEWSNVCLLKAIPTPKLILTDFTTDDDSNNIPIFNPGLIPIAGKVYFDDNLSGTYEETMRSYKISIYTKDNPDDILDSIGPVYTGNSADQNNIYWLADCEIAEPGEIYTLKVTVTTKNQYTFSKTYDFKIYAYDSTPFTPQFNFKRVNLQQYNNLTVDDPNSEISKIITEEDGAVVFTVTTLQSMPPGYLYIKRASSLDNFRHWELISCTKENGEVSQTIEDYTVSSLVRYKYSAQYQTKRGSWTRSYKTSEDDMIYPDFYDMLFYRDGRQLAIRYNSQITNLRPVVNRQKIDTLGGRYPKFAENAKMNYKQFSISGLIDAESDFNRKFLDDRNYSDQMFNYNSQMNGKYEIRNDTIADGELAYQGSSNTEVRRTSKNTYHDLYPKNNWWLEREFREQAIQWLNDGEPKLFRSMSEGNMVVMLTDISLTPNTTLGRRIYNFSATMYEVEDGYSLETLNSLGIVSIVNEKETEKGGTGEGGSGSEEQGSDYLTKTSIGQISAMKFPSLYASVVKGSMTGDTSDKRGLDINYISIEDLYNFIIYDQGSVDGKLYQVVPNSIKLKDVRLRFESKPRWYQFTNGRNKIKLVTASTDPSATSDKNIQLGYKIALNISETGTTENDILIFVNERGYYQVPTNLNITNIKIYDGATATIDYKIEYQIQYNDSQTPTTTELARKVVGQLSGVWRPNTRLSSKIKKIHRFLQYDSENKGKLIMSESLTNWHALSLELTPYSTVSISFEEDDGTASAFNNYLVGRTGIYNLVNDYPIKEVIILGKRMIRADDSRQRFLDDWEFVLDDSAKEDKSASNYELTWNEFVNHKVEETNVLVEINEKTTTAAEEGINRLWNNFDNEQTVNLEGYPSFSHIKQPQSNTVYGIKDGDNIKCMIYYQDAGWYDIEFVPGSNQTIALAKVPVHGMINYWADIMRQTF